MQFCEILKEALYGIVLCIFCIIIYNDRASVKPSEPVAEKGGSRAVT